MTNLHTLPASEETLPATDARIKQLEKWLTMGECENMVGVKRSTVLSLIARIHSERERAIQECAEIAESHYKTFDCQKALADHDDMGYARATTRLEVARAILSLSQVSAENVWRPIETAPRDGTPILAFNSRHMSHAPVVVEWKEVELDPDLGPEPHWADSATASGTALYYNGLYFDYWMPTPAFTSLSQVSAKK